MNLEQYRKEVQRTAVHPTLSNDELVINFAACLIEEVGEVTGVVKKHLWHGHELDREELVKELGDLLWYVVALKNIQKQNLNVDIGGRGLFASRNKESSLLELQSRVYYMQQSYVSIDIYMNGHFDGTLRHLKDFASLFGITLPEIMDTNIAKLKARYPDKFTFEDSINRK